MIGGAGAGSESVRSGVPGTVKESSTDDYDRKCTRMTSILAFDALYEAAQTHVVQLETQQSTRPKSPNQPKAIVGVSERLQMRREVEDVCRDFKNILDK